jgi:hypothetical protein
MEYNRGEHQQPVLKITKGEYSVQSTKSYFLKGLLVMYKLKVKEKMLCERKKFFNYAGIYVQ